MLPKRSVLPRVRTRLAVLFVLPILLLATPLARADTLDFVLDILYNAGVIDGNVKAAKPLINCLANGKSVSDCTLGAAGQTETANDPQVRNVIDIYQTFQQKDWYGLVKKAGVTVACELIPGGSIKDALCGELGKLVVAVVDGVGSVLHSLGDAVVSLFGGDEKVDPLPMWDEDYYRLYFAPAYHKLVMSLDAQDGSFEPIVQSVYNGCKAYYGRFPQYASNVCEAGATRLRDQAKLLQQTLLQEGDSWFQLHSTSTVESWARDHFGQDSGEYIASQVAQCRIAVHTAIPLPNPGFDRCAAFQAQVQKETDPLLKKILAMAIQQQDPQCQAEAKAMQVLPPHDAYAMACETVQKQLPASLLGAMHTWKQRMDLAQGAGCSNEGTPASIHCDTYASQLACVNAIPDKASICGFDVSKADQAFAQQVFTQLDKDSLAAGKPRRCIRTVAQVLCFRPTKQRSCKSYVWEFGGKYGLANQGDAICLLQSDSSYDQLKAKAQQVLAALNAPNATRRDNRVLQHALSPGVGVHAAEPCALSDQDPVVIKCAYGFEWDAQPARAATVTTILGSPFGLCGPNYLVEGADVPCLDGVAVAAFPKGQGKPPTPLIHPEIQLVPGLGQPPKKTSPAKIRPIPTVDTGGH